MLNNYWDDFYKKDGGRTDCSLFVYEVAPLLKPGLVIDIGAGLGHDSKYIMTSRKDVKPIAIEQSKEAINYIVNVNKIPFYCEANVLDLPDCMFWEIPNFYSRFSLHCFSDSQQDELLRKISHWAAASALFFIEARSVKDQLFGKGDWLGGREYFYNGHVRNFIDKKVLKEKLNKFGFDVLETIESKFLAPYKDENPVVIRVVARKIC